MLAGIDFYLKSLIKKKFLCLDKWLKKGVKRRIYFQNRGQNCYIVKTKVTSFQG